MNIEPHLTVCMHLASNISQRELGDKVGIPAFFVDPVCVDDDDVAKILWTKSMEEQASFMQQQKSVAKQRKWKGL